MRVGGPNGIEIDETGVRAGEVFVSGRAVATPPHDSTPRTTIPRPQGASGNVFLASSLGGRLIGILSGVGGISAVGGLIAILVLGLPAVASILPAAVLIATLVLVLARRVLWKPFFARAIERSLLNAAAESGGCLTVAQAARAMDCPLAEADAALSRIVHEGHADVDLDETNGIVRYQFRGLVDPEEPSREERQ